MRSGFASARLWLVVPAVAAALAAGACDEDSNGEVGIIQTAEALFGIQVNDARTGAPLDGVEVKLRITGGAAARVVDVVGERASQLTINTGFVVLGLKGAVPTPAAPAEMVVVATAPGYLETSQRLTLTEQRNQPAIIAMVSLAAPPPGVAVGTSGAARAGPGGVLEATVTVPTAADAATGGRASVTLPAGAVVRDQAGTPLSGPLQTTVVYFNNRNPESLASFPGGFGGTVANPPAGLPAEGVFTSAGYAAITVRDGAGREAETFSAPVQVTLNVPANTRNPATGQAVGNGAVVPYWSYEPGSGNWRYEGQATLTGPNGAGNLTASVAMNHLSFLNLDYLNTTCTQQRVDISGNLPEQPLLLRFSTEGGWFKEAIATSVLYLQWPPPPGVLVLVQAIDYLFTGQIVGSFASTNLCAGPSTLVVSLPPVASLANLSVSVRVRCRRRTFAPWGWIEFRQAGTQRWLLGTYISQGEGRIVRLQPNTTYELRVSGIFGLHLQVAQRVTTGQPGSVKRVPIQFSLSDDEICNLLLHDQGRSNSRQPAAASITG